MQIRTSYSVTPSAGAERPRDSGTGKSAFLILNSSHSPSDPRPINPNIYNLLRPLILLPTSLRTILESLQKSVCATLRIPLIRLPSLREYLPTTIGTIHKTTYPYIHLGHGGQLHPPTPGGHEPGSFQGKYRYTQTSPPRPFLSPDNHSTSSRTATTNSHGFLPI